MDIMDSIFFSRWIFTTIFLSVLSGAGAGIFSTPSLVWLEHENGDVRIQQAPIHSRTWAVDSKGLQPVPIDVTKAAEYTHIAVDHGNQTFVAVDQRTNRIVAITFDDSQLGIAIYWQLYSGTSKKVNGIAVDWTTDVVYWTDAAYDVIMAVSMAVPNMAEVVVGNDLDKPYGIVTHPKKGYLFWADCGSRAHIKRSSLGGRNQHVVRTFRDRRPTVLTVDYAEDRLYWLYRHEDGGLGSCDLYGSGSSYISYDLQEGVQYCDLDIFRGQLVAVRQQRNFYEIHIFPPRHGQPSRKHTVIGRPYGIVAVDQEKQQDRPNPCLRSRCPGICTKSNSTEDCFCHDAWRATENEAIVDMYCQAPAFTGLLLPKGDGIYTIGRNFAEFDRYSRLVPRRILETSHAVKAVTSNVRSSRIFFYVAYTKLIQSVKTEQGSAHTVVSMAVGDVGGLAYDGVSDNLYWTDRVHRHIMVTTGDGQYPVVLLANLNQPSAIAVHPLERLLFWSDLGEMTLERACMDGSDRRRLHPGRRYRVAALALDFQSNRLYFVSRVGWSSSVFQSGLDGNFLEELYSPRYSRFTGITVMHDYLVISDTYYRTSGLYAVDKVTCQFVGNVSYPRHRYGNWYGVAYHHVASQPYRRGVCRYRNPCEQLCIDMPGPQLATCLCSLGYRENGTQCPIDAPFKPYILLADQRYGKLLQIHSRHRQFVSIPVQGLQQPYDVAYDPVGRSIYWTDLEAGSVSRSRLDGSQQEIIIHDRNVYYISLAIDPGARLVYYVVIPRPPHESWTVVSRPREPARAGTHGSVGVYHIDTGHRALLMEGELPHPGAIALNTNYGYMFVVSNGTVWRASMDGTDHQVVLDGYQVNTLTTRDDYLYFATDETDGDYYSPVQPLICRCGLDGGNVTELYRALHSGVAGLSVDNHYLYWINESTRAVQRLTLQEPSVVHTIGAINVLFRPTSIAVNPIEETYDSACADNNGGCSSLCVPTPDGRVCIEGWLMDGANNGTGFCRIPAIPYSDIEDNMAGRLVPGGFKVVVSCYPAHRISNPEPMICRNGTWTHAPVCTLEYDICGDSMRGYKVYVKSGLYFVSPGATKVEVILVGGGGGGYDVTNTELVSAGKAGDGGVSRFGEHIMASGGGGGTRETGGEGGHGSVDGGVGTAGPNCSTGGTAGQDMASGRPDIPGYSYNLFCGAGAYSYNCMGHVAPRQTYAGPGGRNGNGSTAGHYGGGAGSREGGTGGGGGFSRHSFNLPPREVVPIQVGEAGRPSYGEAGPGVVVVMWGGFRIDDYLTDLTDVEDCVIT